jgi:hypothetical protein
MLEIVRDFGELTPAARLLFFGATGAAVLFGFLWARTGDEVVRLLAVQPLVLLAMYLWLRADGWYEQSTSCTECGLQAAFANLALQFTLFGWPLGILAGALFRSLTLRCVAETRTAAGLGGGLQR